MPSRGTYVPPHVFPHAGEGSVRFILVEPVFPGNVGAACRAIKTMGFQQLYIVNGPAHLKESEEARRFAHNAEEVLEAMREMSELAEAVADMHVLIGTTHRSRSAQFPRPRTARAIAESLVKGRGASRMNIGILFGSERRGLTDSELSFCHEVMTIPAATAQPSLNLAQAVQVVAYELYMGHAVDSKAKLDPEPPHRSLLPAAQLSALADHLERTLGSVGFQNRHATPDRFRAALIRMLSRGQMEPRDLKLIHRILQQVDRYVEDHPVVNPAGKGDSNSITPPSG